MKRMKYNMKKEVIANLKLIKIGSDELARTALILFLLIDLGQIRLI